MIVIPNIFLNLHAKEKSEHFNKSAIHYEAIYDYLIRRREKKNMMIMLIPQDTLKLRYWQDIPGLKKHDFYRILFYYMFRIQLFFSPSSNYITKGNITPEALPFFMKFNALRLWFRVWLFDLDYCW